MKLLKRRLELRLPKGQSIFLWGPRKTGKTTYLKERFPKSLVFDFLDSDLYSSVIKRPALLRERILAADPGLLKRPIILDEVQKVPQALDEVQSLIENKGLGFVLCGSSARKLKRGQANLLGGRAWRAELHPLATPEIEDFDLLRALNAGLIPSHYLGVDPDRSLRAYVQDYLKEEVFTEGLTRNVPAFSRFFDAAGFSHGQLVNFSSIARDCGVDAKTVREFYQILDDTLVGTMIEPYNKRRSRQVISRAPRFYFFDVGVAGTITRRRIVEERGEDFGRAFEHFILMELLAYRSYSGSDFPVRFWRTKTGLEVDFVLGDAEAAIEIKGTRRVDPADLKGLRAFAEENRPGKSLLVSNEPAARLVDGVRLLPWREFLSQLWSGRVI